MRKMLLAATCASVALGFWPAHAGSVCFNNDCRNAPAVYGSVNVSLTGQVKASGGLTGGPGLRTTGLDAAEVKPDNVALYPRLDGAALGRFGMSNDTGDRATRVYAGSQGCRELEYDQIYFGPCTDEPDD